MTHLLVDEGYLFWAPMPWAAPARSRASAERTRGRKARAGSRRNRRNRSTGTFKSDMHAGWFTAGWPSGQWVGLGVATTEGCCDGR